MTSVDVLVWTFFKFFFFTFFSRLIAANKNQSITTGFSAKPKGKIDNAAGNYSVYYLKCGEINMFSCSALSKFIISKKLFVPFPTFGSMKMSQMFNPLTPMSD